MNNIDQLREHLFSTLQDIKSGAIEIDKAKVIGELSQILINTAKVEVDFIRANGGGSSSFITAQSAKKETPTGSLTVNGASTVHRLR